MAVVPGTSPSASSLLRPGVLPREVLAWAMYDFANSGYTTVVITAVFSAYFVGVVAASAPWATLAWTTTLAVSYAAVMLAGPAIGAYADQHAAKKRLLIATTAGCVLATAALAFVGPGELALACIVVAISNFFFGVGENLIAAFLPELGRSSALGKLSGWGWAFGYIGGLVSLGASLTYVTIAQARGETSAEFVPVTMLITAAIFLCASLVTLAWLRERAVPQARSPTGALSRVGDTLRHAAHHADLARFLACLVCYQAGVQAVVALAAIYAEQAMGFTTRDTITLILAVNITAAIGALVFGHVQDRIGHVPTIALTLAGWIATVITAWWATDRPLFWVAANLAGLCLGASQSAGRALVGYLSPPRKRAEFFGLWGLAVKLASLLGPLVYGLLTWLVGGDHRLAMVATGSWFVAGLAILMSVNVQRGRRAALRAVRAQRKARRQTG
jgi:UMF1 family MFS transporter